VRRVLYNWTRTKAYREVVANEQAWGHDLEGNRVERVSVEHQGVAASLLLAGALMTNARAIKEPKGNGQAKPQAEPPKVKQPFPHAGGTIRLKAAGAR
jgi:hypothetical protein